MNPDHDDAARALARRLRSGDLRPEDVELACRAVEQLGVPVGELRRRRDDAYWRYRDQVCPNVPAREQARIIDRDARRYFGSGWRKDQNEIYLPKRLWGQPRAHLWEALKHWPLVDLETMRTILRRG